MEKRHLIFDFDGVIADTFEIAFAVAQLTYPTLTRESYKQKWNGNIGDAVFTEPKSDIEIDFQKEFAKRLETIEMTWRTKNSLQLLNEHYDLYIVSSTNTETIVSFLKRHKIKGLFKKVLGVDVESSKVKKFQMLFKKYSIQPEKVLFVTDTMGDIKEATEVGIKKIYPVYGTYTNLHLLKTTGLQVFDSLISFQQCMWDDELGVW
jgi:phosphoglycolate phosphatase-like HAD superfamily hydrolase